MWSYKYLNKDTKLHVPKFKTFFFQNQELLNLWYEDETEPLEERIHFAMRCLKYVAHLFILFVLIIAIIDARDLEHYKHCDQRLKCYNNCNKAFFPSLLCQQFKKPKLKEYVIEVKGNKAKQTITLQKEEAIIQC